MMSWQNTEQHPDDTSNCNHGDNLLKSLSWETPTCSSPATLEVYPRGRSLSLNLKATVFKSCKNKR